MKKIALAVVVLSMAAFGQLHVSDSIVLNSIKKHADSITQRIDSLPSGKPCRKYIVYFPSTKVYVKCEGQSDSLTEFYLWASTNKKTEMSELDYDVLVAAKISV